MNTVVDYFLYFLFYGFMGWVIEMIYNVCVLKRVVNRGYLIGPICSIYGFGFLITILLVGDTSKNFVEVYAKSFVVVALLEYITSYLMEKIFRARWWNYSRHKFNLNGRICLETLIPFGFFGCLIILVIHPNVIRFFDGFSYDVKYIFALVCLILYIIDNIFSCFFMNKIKKQIKNSNIDNTELIRKKTIEWINSNSLYYRRIINAFPKFIINPLPIKKRKKRDDF